jgi:hypothetical protein
MPVGLASCVILADEGTSTMMWRFIGCYHLPIARVIYFNYCYAIQDEQLGVFMKPCSIPTLRLGQVLADNSETEAQQLTRHLYRYGLRTPPARDPGRQRYKASTFPSLSDQRLCLLNVLSSSPTLTSSYFQ